MINTRGAINTGAGMWSMLLETSVSRLCSSLDLGMARCLVAGCGIPAGSGRYWLARMNASSHLLSVWVGCLKMAHQW